MFASRGGSNFLAVRLDRLRANDPKLKELRFTSISFDYDENNQMLDGAIRTICSVLKTNDQLESLSFAGMYIIVSW
jgi:hypothetical protein